MTKKQITAQYTAPGFKPPGTTTALAQRNRLEQNRLKEQDRLNERRFDQYNVRRKAHGLPEIPYADYLARKHGLVDCLRQVRDLKSIPAISAEHRDKIILFTR